MTERHCGRAKLPLSQRFGSSLTLPFPESRSVIYSTGFHAFMHRLVDSMRRPEAYCTWTGRGLRFRCSGESN